MRFGPTSTDTRMRVGCEASGWEDAFPRPQPRWPSVCHVRTGTILLSGMSWDGSNTTSESSGRVRTGDTKRHNTLYGLPVRCPSIPRRFSPRLHRTSELRFIGLKDFPPPSTAFDGW